MILKTIYKNNFSYFSGIHYFDACMDDRLLIAKGINIYFEISKIDKFIVFNDNGQELENITFKKEQ